MTASLIALVATFRSALRSRLDLEAEILALRHQLAVLQRWAPRRPRLGQVDRLLWVVLSRLWPNWRRAIQIVRPETVVRWHRRAFALAWSWKSRRRRPGRPPVAADFRALIRQMQAANPLWGAPRFLVRDRDAIYGSELRRTARVMGLEEVVTAPRAPWQNPFVERLIGSLRRKCLDHVIVWNERSLRRCLRQYLAYYHVWGTHLSLDKDPPVPRRVQPTASGTIVRVPHLGGLHHHYARRAA
jgi:hypothetical protein